MTTRKLIKADPRVGDLTVERGTSGLNRFGGHVEEDHLRELTGDRGRRNLKEFSENDPIAGAILFAVRSLAMGTTWRVDPGDTDNLHLEQADFVSGALFDDMSTSWMDTLSAILTFLPFGWAFHELVFKRRGGDVRDPSRRSKFMDNRVGWRKWPLRAQDTLDEWVFDENGGVQGMWQDAGTLGGPRRQIPIEKALLFRTETTKNNPEGRSVLRNAWTSFYRKKHIENILGIGIERDLVGLPVFQVKEPDASKGFEVPDIFGSDSDATSTLNEFKKIAKSIRNDEQSGLVVPYWMEFRLQGMDGRRQFDLEKVLERYDKLIAITVLADFLLIGHAQTGSRALVSSRVDLFSTALKSFLELIRSVVNRFAIPQLLRLNGMPVDAPPTLEYGAVERVDLDTLGEYVSKLAGSGMLLFGSHSAELERALLERAHLPTEGIVDDPEDRDELGERDPDPVV